MKRQLFSVLLAAATLATQARAQTPAPGQRPGVDPFARFFFPPELVLQHVQELKLAPEQRTLIVNAVKEAQGELFDLQLQMADRTQELMKTLGLGPLLQVDGKLLSSERVEEAAVLAQVDKILAVERDIKRRQLQLLIRIRNALTREQQEQLARYRDTAPRPEGAPF